MQSLFTSDMEHMLKQPQESSLCRCSNSDGAYYPCDEDCYCKGLGHCFCLKCDKEVEPVGGWDEDTQENNGN